VQSWLRVGYELCNDTKKFYLQKNRNTANGMPRNLFRGGGVPRSLISKRVKIPPVLFTRIGAEANSGRVSLARGNLKSLRPYLA